MSDLKRLAGHTSADPDLLDEIVETFEVAWNQHGSVDVADFMPAPGSPSGEAISLELLCVDMERRWRHGSHKTTKEYAHEFPSLLSAANHRERLAFEEYRLRSDGAQPISPDEFEGRYAIDTSRWPRFDSTHADDGLFSTRFEPHDSHDARAIAPPQIGQRFLDFDIVNQLGEGTFGQVYLARQSGLAGRLVVVKVTTSRWCESDRLARLQHTNIMPIYSVHQQDSLQVVCMPYLGSRTLADVLTSMTDRRQWDSSAITDPLAPGSEARSERASAVDDRSVHDGHSVLNKERRDLTFEQFCLWVVGQVARGVAHAHRRGILHRDLKPANILLTDEGQPMILDFNLSEDEAAMGRGPRLVGGTLPYMAPEHLRAIAGHGRVDRRSDIYSLGVILFQMLTGELPYPTERDTSVGAIERMAQRRIQPAPSARRLNMNVSPAIESIISRCLASKPDARYQQAGQLYQDIDCQLHDLPLRHSVERSIAERVGKWWRRHPRITSAASLGVIASTVVLIVLAAFVWRGRELARIQATDQFRSFQPLARQSQAALCVQMADGEFQEVTLQDARTLLSSYGLPHKDWRSGTPYKSLSLNHRRELNESLQQLLYLLANAGALGARDKIVEGAPPSRLVEALHFNQIARGLSDPTSVPAALSEQHADLLKRLGRQDSAIQAGQRAMDSRSSNPVDDRLWVVRQIGEAQYVDALARLNRLESRSPQDFFLWFLKGLSYGGLGRYRDADACFTSCAAIWPQSHLAFFQRGICRQRLGDFAMAEQDFTESLKRNPDLAAVHFNRALSRREQQDYEGAIDDLTAVIEHRPQDPLGYLMREMMYRKIGKLDQAAEDVRTAVQLTPVDVDGWLLRGLARATADPERALLDIDQALRLEPDLPRALNNRAYILSEHLGRDADAIATIDRLLRLRPGDSKALVERGLLHSRLGQHTAAVRDVRRAIQTDVTPLTCYRAACILARAAPTAPEYGDQAVALLSQALQREGHWVNAAVREFEPTVVADREDYQRLIDAICLVQGIDPSSLTLTPVRQYED